MDRHVSAGVALVIALLASGCSPQSEEERIEQVKIELREEQGFNLLSVTPTDDEELYEAVVMSETGTCYREVAELIDKDVELVRVAPDGERFKLTPLDLDTALYVPGFSPTIESCP